MPVSNPGGGFGSPVSVSIPPAFTLAGRPDPVANEGKLIYVADAPIAERLQYAVITGQTTTEPGGPVWGPNGLKKPPNTPNYSTAATATAATFAALQTALNAAAAGDVIEYTGTDMGDIVLRTLTGGNAAWGTKVLIRPPLGERRDIYQMDLQADNTVVAGFDNTSRLRLNGNAIGAAFWRCVAKSPAVTWFNMATTDSWFVECVHGMRYYGMNVDAKFVHQSNNNDDSVGGGIDGCFLAGGCNGVASVASGNRKIHGEVNAPFVGQVLDSEVIGAGGFTVTTMLVATPKNVIASGNTITVELRRNGAPMLTVTAPAPNYTIDGNTWGISNSDYGGLFDQNVPYAEGDLMEAVVTSITGTVPRVLAHAGLEVSQHGDTLQTFEGGALAGRILNATFKDSMIDGAENAALQMEHHKDDCVITGNWIGRDRNYTINWSVEATAVLKRLHFIENYVIGSPFLNAGTLLSLEGNQVRSFANLHSAPFTPSATNTVNPSLPTTRPDLADLTAIWPECPPAFDPTGV
jgi:hypothetical protein